MKPFFGIRKINNQYVLEFNSDGLPASDEYDPKQNQMAHKAFAMAKVAPENTSNSMFIIPEAAISNLIEQFEAAGFVLGGELHTIGPVPKVTPNKVKIPASRHQGQSLKVLGKERITGLSTWEEIDSWKQHMDAQAASAQVTGKEIFNDLDKSLETYYSFGRSLAGKEIAKNQNAILSPEAIKDWAAQVAQAVTLVKLKRECPLAQAHSEYSKFHREPDYEKLRQIWETSAEEIVQDPSPLIRFVPDIKGTSWTATGIFAQEGKAWCVPTSSYLLSFLKSLHDLGNDIPISKENNLPIELTSPFGIRGEELGGTIDCEYPFEVSISKTGTARVTFTEEQANSIRKGIGQLKEMLPDINYP